MTLISWKTHQNRHKLALSLPDPRDHELQSPLGFKNKGLLGPWRCVAEMAKAGRPWARLLPQAQQHHTYGATTHRTIGKTSRRDPLHLETQRNPKTGRRGGDAAQPPEGGKLTCRGPHPTWSGRSSWELLPREARSLQRFTVKASGPEGCEKQIPPLKGAHRLSMLQDPGQKQSFERSLGQTQLLIFKCKCFPSP